MPKLSQIAVSSDVDSTTKIVGTKTIAAVETDQLYTIDQIADYIGSTAAGVPRIVKSSAHYASNSTNTVPYIVPITGDEVLRLSGFASITNISSGTLVISAQWTDTNSSLQNYQWTSANATGFLALATITVPCKAGTTCTIRFTFTGASIVHDNAGVIEKLI